MLPYKKERWGGLAKSNHLSFAPHKIKKMGKMLCNFLILLANTLLHHFITLSSHFSISSSATLPSNFLFGTASSAYQVRFLIFLIWFRQYNVSVQFYYYLCFLRMDMVRLDTYWFLWIFIYRLLFRKDLIDWWPTKEITMDKNL